MDLFGTLIGLGAPLLARAATQKFGNQGGRIAEFALGELATVFNTDPTPEALIPAIEADKQAGEKIATLEARTADVILAEVELQKAGNDQQRMTNELLKETMKQKGWRSDWLYAWQWFLMFAWAWAFIVVHILNAGLRVFGQIDANMPAPDLGTLTTVTVLYLGLHMGGHTVLEIIRNKWGGLFDKLGGGRAA